MRLRTHRCTAEPVEPRSGGETSRIMMAAGARHISLNAKPWARAHKTPRRQRRQPALPRQAVGGACPPHLHAAFAARSRASQPEKARSRGLLPVLTPARSRPRGRAARRARARAGVQGANHQEGGQRLLVLRRKHVSHQRRRGGDRRACRAHAAHGLPAPAARQSCPSTFSGCGRRNRRHHGVSKPHSADDEAAGCKRTCPAFCGGARASTLAASQAPLPAAKPVDQEPGLLPRRARGGARRPRAPAVSQARPPILDSQSASSPPPTPPTMPPMGRMVASAGA